MSEMDIFLTFFVSVIVIAATWEFFSEDKEYKRIQAEQDEAYRKMLDILDKQHELVVKQVIEHNKREQRRHT